MYGEHCADQVERAAEVISQHYLGGMEATENNARVAIRQAVWDQLVLATAIGFDVDQIMEEITALCETQAPAEGGSGGSHEN